METRARALAAHAPVGSARARGEPRERAAASWVNLHHAYAKWSTSSSSTTTAASASASTSAATSTSAASSSRLLHGRARVVRGVRVH